MTAYAIHAQILTHDGPYGGSRGLPTFYLDSRVQGITDREHAARIAGTIINPAGLIPAYDLLIAAYPIDPARESAELDWPNTYPYRVTLPVGNDLPALTVVTITVEAGSRESAIALAVTEAESRGYAMDFNNRVALAELD